MSDIVNLHSIHDKYLSAKLPVLMSLRPTLDRAALPPEGAHGVVLGGAVAHVEEAFPLGWPGPAVTKLPDHPTVVTVINCCFLPKNCLLYFIYVHMPT